MLGNKVAVEFIDRFPDHDFPWTVFDAKEGFVIDRACCYKSASDGYGLMSAFPDMVVILRTATALAPTHAIQYHR